MLLQSIRCIATDIVGEVDVDAAGRAQIRVPEQVLNRDDVYVGCEEQRRVRVSQGVRSDVAFPFKSVTESPKASLNVCLLYTSPSPRDQRGSRMPSSA